MLRVSQPSPPLTLVLKSPGYGVAGGGQLDDVVDLVIPRGSNRLVASIKENTKIAVLGHAGKTLKHPNSGPRLRT